MQAIVQQTPWSCGPATLLSVLRRFGLGPANESTLTTLCHTAPMAGTPPEMMLNVAKRLGLDCEARYRMTVAQFERELIQGRTVIICLQGHGSPESMAAGQSGHWSAAFGMGRRFIYFLDPAAGNGLSCLPRGELPGRWRDRDGRGRVWNRFGVVVRGVQAMGFAEDAHGHEHAPAGESDGGQFVGKGGGSGSKKKEKPDKGKAASTSKLASPTKPTIPEQQPSEKAARAKLAHKLVNKDIQRYAEEYNEPRFAKVVGGVSHPDSEPMDVTAKNGDLVEIKTLVDNSNSKITMDSYSQVRKIVKESETGKTFHTVVSDDQKIYNAGGEGKHGDDSKRRYFYRRGVAGSARIGSLHECKDEAELLKLMKMPEDKLPAAAQRTDAKLRVGKWKFFHDETGKGYKNSKTGVIFRAKK